MQSQPCLRLPDAQIMKFWINATALERTPQSGCKMVRLRAGMNVDPDKFRHELKCLGMGRAGRARRGLDHFGNIGNHSLRPNHFETVTGLAIPVR